MGGGLVIAFSFTLTRTDDDTGDETELEIEAVPVDPPSPAEGITGWTFAIFATLDGRNVTLTQRETDRAADIAAEMLRKETAHDRRRR